MLAPTHSVFGIFITLIVLAVFGVSWSLHWSIIVVAVLGAVLPDIDHPRSMVGRAVPLVSNFLERKFGHRTVTHSLVGWVVATVAFGLVAMVVMLGLKVTPQLVTRWVGAFSISYLSHLILDMFNRRGSQLFWPNTGRDVIPKNPKFRPESGDKVEVLIFVILVMLMVLALPISKYGISSSLRWLLATPESAMEEFKTLKVHAYLDFKGVFRQDKTVVEGEAEILDVVNKRLVVRYGGVNYTLSGELSADIIASNVRVRKSDVALVIENRTFTNATQEWLVAQIPTGALVSGVVHLPKGMKLEFPQPKDNLSSCRTMEQNGDDLLLNYATKEEIVSLQLNVFYQLQQKKDELELRQLARSKADLELELRRLEQYDDGLTALGRKLLMDKEKQAEQELKISGVKTELERVTMQLEELTLVLKSRESVYSGEVSLRK